MTIDRRQLLALGLALGGTAVLAACSASAASVPAPGPASPDHTTRPPADPSAVPPESASPSASPTASPASTTPRGPAIEVSHGTTGAATVALTFHGAGDPRLAERLLVAAEAGGARVTVLAVGTWLSANRSMADRILSAGHELGNHTWTHPAMRTEGEPDVLAEARRCRELLETLTGSGRRWFRPSGIQHATPAILTAAGATGYPQVLSYDVDPRDYTDPGSTAVSRRLLAAVRPGSVVSLHLGHQGTIDAMPAILSGLTARGLTAVTASQLIPA